MSFLLKKKKIFLFVFSFFIVFFINVSSHTVFAEPISGWGGADAHTGGTYTQNEAGQITESPQQEGDSDPGWWVMRIVEGLTAAAIPFAAAAFIPIGMIAFSLSSLVLGISSYGIDLALEIGVNLISQIVNSPGDPIKTTWIIFRNIANVGIIFTILFIAIKTILRSSGYEAKALLGKVIIAALLINFSFLFGAIVVDVSNEMSLTIYKEIASVTGDKEKVELGSFMFEHAQPSIFQSAIAKQDDPNAEEYFDQTFEKTESSNSAMDGLRSAALWTVNLSIGYIMGTIANLVLASVLYVGIFMIYTRVIIILILLVVSPIAFATMILPSTEKISKDWWNSLIGQSFFLPAFLLFILVGVKIIKNLPEQEGVVTQASQLQLTSIASYASIFTPFVFKYLLIIGLFVMALMAAKKVQGMGSAAVGTLSTSITSMTGGAVSAGGAWLGRNTVGGVANKSADWLSKKDFAQTRTGMALLSGIKGVAKNSFDARNSKAFQGVASATGVGDGFGKYIKPQADGYTGQQKRAVEQRIKLAENLNGDLSDEQLEKANEAKRQLDAMVDNDGTVLKARTDKDNAEEALKNAKASNNMSAIQAAQRNLTQAKEDVEKAEAAVKKSKPYTDKKATDLDSIRSARGKYAKKMEEGFKKRDRILETTGGAWTPFIGKTWSNRSADREAAKKIMKQKSETEKLLDKLKEMTNK